MPLGVRFNREQIAFINAFGCTMERDPFSFYELLVDSIFTMDERERFLTPQGEMVVNPEDVKGDRVHWSQSPVHVRAMRKARYFFRHVNGKVPLRAHAVSGRTIVNDFGHNFAFRFGDKVVVLDFDPKDGMTGEELASVVRGVGKIFNAAPMMVCSPSGGVHLFVRLPHGMGGYYANQAMSAKLRSFVAKELFETTGVVLPDSSRLGIDVRVSKDFSAFTVAAGSSREGTDYVMVYPHDRFGRARTLLEAHQGWVDSMCDRAVAEQLVADMTPTKVRSRVRAVERKTRREQAHSRSENAGFVDYSEIVKETGVVTDSGLVGGTMPVSEAASHVANENDEVSTGGAEQGVDGGQVKLSQQKAELSIIDQRIVASREITRGRSQITDLDVELVGEACAQIHTDYERDTVQGAVMHKAAYVPYVNDSSDNARIDNEVSPLPLSRALRRYVSYLAVREPNLSFHIRRYKVLSTLVSCHDLVTVARVCRVLGIDRDTSSGKALGTNALRLDILRAWRKYVEFNNPKVGAHSRFCGCPKQSHSFRGSSRDASGLGTETLRLLRSYTKWTVLNFTKASRVVKSVTRATSQVRRDAHLILAMMYGFGLSGVVGARLSQEYLAETYGVSFDRRKRALRVLSQAGILRLVRMSSLEEHRSSMWLVAPEFIDFMATKNLRLIRYNTRVDNSVPAVLHTAVMFDGSGNAMSLFDGEYQDTELAPVYPELTNTLFDVALDTARKVNVTNHAMWERVSLGYANPVTVPLEEAIRVSLDARRGKKLNRHSLYNVREKDLTAQYDTTQHNFNIQKGVPAAGGAFDYVKLVLEPLNEAVAKANARAAEKMRNTTHETTSSATVISDSAPGVLVCPESNPAHKDSSCDMRTTGLCYEQYTNESCPDCLNQPEVSCEYVMCYGCGRRQKLKKEKHAPYEHVAVSTPRQIPVSRAEELKNTTKPQNIGTNTPEVLCDTVPLS